MQQGFTSRRASMWRWRGGVHLGATGVLTCAAARVLRPRNGRLRARLEALETRLCLSADGSTDPLPALLSLSRGAGSGVATAMPVESTGSGSIAGTVFNDFNGNGTLDNGDSGINGVTVFLDLNQSNTFDAGDASTTTNSSGNYVFNNLADGTYSIGIVPPSGYVRTGSTFQGATVIGGGAVSGRNFGNFRTTYVGSNGSDSWTIRLDAADPARLQVLQTLLGQSTVTWSVSKLSVPSLTVIAEAGDDLITIDHSNGNPTPPGGISIDGGSQSTAMADRVSVTGSAGNDVLVVHHADHAPPGAALVVRNVERVSLTGGLGNDTFAVSRTLMAEVTVDGGAGTDSLTWTGTEAVESLTLTAGTISDGAFTTQYTVVESLTMHLLGGSDVVSLSHSSAAPTTTIDLGDGNDVVTVTSANTSGITLLGGNGNDSVSFGNVITAPVSFNGGPGTDRITVIGSDGDDVLDVESTQVFRQGNFWPATFTAVEALVVEGGLGNDTIQLLSTSPSTPVTINGGGGNDALTIAAAPTAPITFNGGTSAGDQDVLNVNAGTYTFAADAKATSANLTVNVGSAGNVAFNATQHLAGLNVAGTATLSAGGSKVLVTRALSFSGNGKLNLTDNDLIVNYTGPASPMGTWNGSAYTGIAGFVSSGRNEGAWNGNGIMTSSASIITGLGVAESADVLGLSGSQTDLWSGETVDATAVLVKYTYAGDANLDGMLNIDDYGQIDFNAGFSGLVFGHFNGDFNLDGLINIDDYGEIDFTIGIQGPPL